LRCQASGHLSRKAACCFGKICRFDGTEDGSARFFIFDEENSKADLWFPFHSNPEMIRIEMPYMKESIMSFDFRCPHCGSMTNIEEKYIGMTGPCAQCGKTITIHRPESVLPPSNPILPASPRKTNKILIILLAVVFLVALAGGGVLTSLWISGHKANQRIICLNNQKEIALAIISYESEKGHFPPAYTVDKDGKPIHSWRVLILPHLNRMDLYNQYRMDEPWNSPHNLRLSDKMPRVYHCPADTDSPNCTSYAMLVGPHAVFSDPKHPRSSSFISSKDGTSETLLLVEAADAKINWLEPHDLNVEAMAFKINAGSKEITSHHAGGAAVSFCDGHCAFLRTDIKPETLKALTTVDGHEAVDEGEY
jgi:hypothetical protein